MREQIKRAIIGLAAVAGLASAALAQQPAGRAEQPPQAQSGHGMNQGDGMMSGKMPMMKNPETHQRMAEMMAKCTKMMEQMGNMPAAKPGN